MSISGSDAVAITLENNGSLIQMITDMFSTIPTFYKTIFMGALAVVVVFAILRLILGVI